jgi:hypothetical protein
LCCTLRFTQKIQKFVLLTSIFPPQPLAPPPLQSVSMNLTLLDAIYKWDRCLFLLNLFLLHSDEVALWLGELQWLELLSPVELHLLLMTLSFDSTLWKTGNENSPFFGWGHSVKKSLHLDLELNQVETRGGPGPQTPLRSLNWAWQPLSPTLSCSASSIGIPPFRGSGVFLATVSFALLVWLQT